MYCWTSFAKFAGKNLCWSLFLIKMQAFRPTTLFKKCSNTGVFLLNISKLLRTPPNISERLVLSKKYSKLFLNLYFELWKLSQSKIPFQKLIQIFPLNFCYPPPKFKYWLTNYLSYGFINFLQLQQQYLLHIVHQCIVETLTEEFHPSMETNTFLICIYKFEYITLTWSVFPLNYEPIFINVYIVCLMLIRNLANNY